MQSLQESLAFWATMLQTVLSFITVIQSNTWLLIISLTSVASAAVIGQYSRQDSLVLASGTLEVEGRRLDCLNAADLRRNVNTTLVVQEARQTARVEGNDLTITWRYSGYSKTDGTSHLQFSVDGDNNVPFGSLECFAHDLRHDPERQHKIRPILVGADGMTRKLLIPFAEPLAKQDPFDILIHCHLPGCMRLGLDYVTATLSFEQPHVDKLTVQLEFVGEMPAWVRVYENAPGDNLVLLKDLKASEHRPNSSVFTDNARRVAGQSARIYTFWRNNRSRYSGRGDQS